MIDTEYSGHLYASNGAGVQGQRSFSDILVIEADMAMAAMLAELFARMAYPFELATNMVEATAYTRYTAPRVVIVDLDSVPWRQTVRFLSHLAHRHPSFLLILLSIYSADHYSSSPELHKLGIQGRILWMDKPFRNDELLRPILCDVAPAQPSPHPETGTQEIDL